LGMAWIVWDVLTLDAIARTANSASMSKSTITLNTIIPCRIGEYIWIGTKMFRVLDQQSGYTLVVGPARWWARLWHWTRGRWASIRAHIG
jgi:hypothetical protein